MPLPKREKRITLEEVGAPEFEVTFLRLVGMRYGEVLEIAKEEESSEDEATARNFFVKMIVSWSIEDEEGKVQPLPSDDPEVVLRLPSVFVDYISEEIRKEMNRDSSSFPLVTESEISSQATS